MLPSLEGKISNSSENLITFVFLNQTWEYNKMQLFEIKTSINIGSQLIIKAIIRLVNTNTFISPIYSFLRWETEVFTRQVKVQIGKKYFIYFIDKEKKPNMAEKKAIFVTFLASKAAPFQSFDMPTYWASSEVEARLELGVFPVCSSFLTCRSGRVLFLLLALLVAVLVIEWIRNCSVLSYCRTAY